MRQFKLSRDPQFAAKLKDIVGLYVNPAQCMVTRRCARGRRDLGSSWLTDVNNGENLTDEIDVGRVIDAIYDLCFYLAAKPHLTYAHDLSAFRRSRIE